MTTIQLYNADCLEQMKLIADKSIDLIICDLLYGCLSGRAIGKNAEEKGCFSGAEAGCAWDIKINLDLFWTQIRRIRKDDHTPCIHFCSTKFGIDLINSNPKEFRYDLVWIKPNAVGFLSANKKPMASHEMLYVFSKSGAKYNRIDIEGDFPAGGGGRSVSRFIPSINGLSNINSTTIGKRCPKSYIDINNKKEKGAHPTAKPVELYKWLIERYSNINATVLDPTFGGANSALACIELNRNYIGIEMNEEFFKKAQKKLIPL
jgi:site-specific DNA-methyltransferase (adenine-specific)